MSENDNCHCSEYQYQPKGGDALWLGSKAGVACLQAKPCWLNWCASALENALVFKSALQMSRFTFRLYCTWPNRLRSKSAIQNRSLCILSHKNASCGNRLLGPAIRLLDFVDCLPDLTRDLPEPGREGAGLRPGAIRSNT